MLGQLAKAATSRGAIAFLQQDSVICCLRCLAERYPIYRGLATPRYLTLLTLAVSCCQPALFFNPK